MAVAGLRIVDRAGSSWVVRAAPGASATFSSPTQGAAIDFARTDLAASETGGTLEIYTYRGQLKKRETIPGQLPSSPGHQEPTPLVHQPEPQVSGGISRLKMAYVWPAAVAAALLLARYMTPWQMIGEAAQAQGLSQGMQDLGFYIAGQTVPAVLATIGTCYVLGYWRQEGNGLLKIVIVAALFFASALICRELGLGRVVDLYSGTPINAPGFISFPFYVASAYINSWGIGLFLASLVIGVASALHLEKWRTEHAS